MQRIISLLTNQYFRFSRDTATGERWFVIGLWWDDDHAVFINVPLPYIQRS
jgi:hypothetical protein